MLLGMQATIVNQVAVTSSLPASPGTFGRPSLCMICWISLEQD